MLVWSSRGQATAWLYSHLKEINSPLIEENCFAIFPFPGSKQKRRFFLPQNKTSFSPLFEESRFPKAIHREDVPNRKEWDLSVQKALEACISGRLQKVVLARKTTLTFDHQLDPLEIFSSLYHRRKNATLFLFAPSGEKAFIGASPEMLYSRNGRFLQTEALAGTAPLNSPRIFNNNKNQSELNWVKIFLKKRLSELSETINIGEESIIETARVKHLYCKFSAHLRSGILDSNIIAALHPTPAIGGMPQTSAIAFLKEQETFSRDLYACALGWLNKERAEIAVGIRSALIDGSKMHLYAGVGIVEGSDPEMEWEELEQKIALYI